MYIPFAPRILIFSFFKQLAGLTVVVGKKKKSLQDAREIKEMQFCVQRVIE